MDGSVRCEHRRYRVKFRCAPNLTAPPLNTPSAFSSSLDDDEPLTNLLQRAQHGDEDAEALAVSRVYGTLHELATSYLRREREDNTLQPTALVHEAYIRLLGQQSPWRNRSHFFGIAAQTMRRILVDQARRSSAVRRDRSKQVSLELIGEPDAADDSIGHWGDAPDIIGVHEALQQMERVDPRQAKVVELKFFVGLTLDEIAEVLGISHATVSREWSMARAWLRQRLDAP